MASGGGAHGSIFDMVSAARDFLWDVAPLRHQDSERALEVFLEVVRQRKLPAFQLRALLLDVLRFLDRHTNGRIPSLVERFALECRDDRDSVRVFSRCVEDVFRYRGIGHPLVQQAIAIVEAHYQDPHFTTQSLAQALKIRQSSLDATCLKETGMSPGDILKETRLRHAAAALTRTSNRIKEVSATAGYKHESTFNHDFRARFGAAPSVYRRRAIVPAALPIQPVRNVEVDRRAARINSSAAAAILVIDDNEGMRITTGRYLRLRGYEVTEVETGRQAVQEAGRKAFSLFLIDLHMEDMSGLECLDRLRQCRGEAREVQAMILTADIFAVDELRERAAALGATIHSKLCDADTLCDLVDGLVRPAPPDSSRGSGSPQTSA